MSVSSPRPTRTPARRHPARPLPPPAKPTHELTPEQVEILHKVYALILSHTHTAGAA